MLRPLTEKFGHGEDGAQEASKHTDHIQDLADKAYDALHDFLHSFDLGPTRLQLDSSTTVFRTCCGDVMNLLLFAPRIVRRYGGVPVRQTPKYRRCRPA